MIIQYRHITRIDWNKQPRKVKVKIEPVTWRKLEPMVPEFFRVEEDKVKVLRVKFSDGKTWQVPAKIVAENRAAYYEQKEPGCYQREFELAMEYNSELYEWALDNMYWSDLEPYAVLIKEAEAESISYDEEWTQAPVEICEE